MRDAASGADEGCLARAGNAARVVSEKVGLATVPLQEHHDFSSFKCFRSPRIEGFFAKEWPRLKQGNYCKVFVLEDITDVINIIGYYTLSSAVVQKENLSNRHEKDSPFGFSAPMVRIGFMGRRDGSLVGTGKLLIADAAKRVSLISDLGIVGIVLEPEGGVVNNRLAEFYKSLGFKTCRGNASMYALLKDLVD
jgi:hypothetical protein